MSSLSNCKRIRTYNQLVHKRTLNHFVKLGVVIFSSLVTLNGFQTLVLRLYCWLWTGKYWLGNVCNGSIANEAIKTILNLFIFFYEKNFSVKKAPKRNTNDSPCLRIVALVVFCLLIFVLIVHVCLWRVFVRSKSFRKKQ